ncbi:hypothetical protein [Bradyrhizobium lablabi]|uniref:hypothetical protein n=1 Tax=Bradyrhizobium lablabi TaxID=722472 RepID=UPI0032E4B145
MAEPQKITFAEMRAAGVRGLLIYCGDYRCSHWTAISGDRWPDDVRLSDLEPRFICQACGQRGADVRPNFHWEEEAKRATPARSRLACGMGQAKYSPSYRLALVKPE